MEQFTIGADPEVFFADRSGACRSAIGRVGGSKEEPREIGVGFVQEDNVAAEFNIAPQTTPEAFSSNIQAMLDVVAKLAADHGMVLSKKVISEFSEEDLSHPNAMVFGCDPDLNVWAQAQNCIPDTSGIIHRVVGGHVHVGYDFKDIAETDSFIKALDLFLAVPAVLVDDPKRKELYGKAGSFRIKSYGVEYRTLSNFWVFSHERRLWVYDAVCKALEMHKDIIVHRSIEHIINSGDVAGAKEVMAQYHILPVPEK